MPRTDPTTTVTLIPPSTRPPSRRRCHYRYAGRVGWGCFPCLLGWRFAPLSSSVMTFLTALLPTVGRKLDLWVHIAVKAPMFLEALLPRRNNPCRAVPLLQPPFPPRSAAVHLRHCLHTSLLDVHEAPPTSNLYHAYVFGKLSNNQRIRRASPAVPNE